MTHDLLFWIITFILAGGGAYFGSYLSEKGKNYATKEDVQTLTKLAEEIKADIESKTWLAQRRWDLKRDLYWDLIKQLGEAHGIALDMAYHLNLKREPPGDVGERFSRTMEELLVKNSLSHVILPEEALKAFGRLAVGGNKIGLTMQKISGMQRDSSYWEQLTALAKELGNVSQEALNIVVDCAKNDLLTVTEPKV